MNWITYYFHHYMRRTRYCCNTVLYCYKQPFFIVTNSHTNHVHTSTNTWAFVCAVRGAEKNQTTDTGQRNLPVRLSFYFISVRLYEPTHVPGAHFICPPAVPLVSPDLSSPLILCNDVSFFTSHQPQSHKFLPSALTERLFVCM